MIIFLALELVYVTRAYARDSKSISTTSPEVTTTDSAIRTTIPAITTEGAIKVTPSAISIDDVHKKVKPGIVVAVLTKDTMGFKKGSNVEVVMDANSGRRYYIKDDKHAAWVSPSCLKISSEYLYDISTLTKEEKEAYINLMGFSSSTKWLIWTDITRQELNIFNGKKGEWKLYCIFTCATGKNETPTKRGFFSIYAKGESFGMHSKEGAKYFSRFSGTYMIHSITYRYGKVYDTTVGKRISHGCIRLELDRAKWIYENIPLGSAVWIN